MSVIETNCCGFDGLTDWMTIETWLEKDLSMIQITLTTTPRR